MERRRHVLIVVVFLTVLCGAALMWYLRSAPEEAPPGLAPAPPMEEVVPMDTTLFVWGDPAFLDWEQNLAWLPDGRSLLNVVRKEMYNLGVPVEKIHEVGMGTRIVDQRHDWFVFLDGEWDAQQIFQKTLEKKGAEVDVDGTKAVRIQERGLLLPGGSNRIIAGSDEMVRSIVSLMNGKDKGAAETIRALEEGLPSAPLNVALLQRYTYFPGLQQGVFRLGLKPSPTVEGRISCISGYEGCDRFQQKIYLYIEDLKQGTLPEGIPAFLERIRLVEEPGKKTMRVTSAP